MNRLCLADSADLAVYFDADTRRYSQDWFEKNGLTLERFVTRFHQSPSLGFVFDGRQFGGLIIDNGELHLAILPEFQGRWSLLIPDILDWIFSHHDPIFCRAEHDNELCLQFARRMGWKLVDKDEHYYFFAGKAEWIPANLQRRCRKNQRDKQRTISDSRLIEKSTGKAACE